MAFGIEHSALYTALMLAINAGIFLHMYRLIKKNDPGCTVEVETLDYPMMATCMILNVALTHMVFADELIHSIFYSVFLSSLLFNAYVDMKTQQIYRVYSVATLILSFIYFGYQSISGFGLYEGYIGDVAVSTVIFAALIYAGHFFHIFNTGDAIMMVAICMFITTITGETPMLRLETFGIHFCITNILMIFGNIFMGNMNWKRFRLKEANAYCPWMYAATLIMMAIEGGMPQWFRWSI